MPAAQSTFDRTGWIRRFGAALEDTLAGARHLRVPFGIYGTMRIDDRRRARPGGRPTAGPRPRRETTRAGAPPAPRSARLRRSARTQCLRALDSLNASTPKRMLFDVGSSVHAVTPMKTFAETSPDRPMQLEEAVWIDPGRMSGVPCFRGTRLPVQQLFDWIEDGVPVDEFQRDFQIDPRAIAAVLRAGATAVCAARNPQSRLRPLPPDTRA